MSFFMFRLVTQGGICLTGLYEKFFPNKARANFYVVHLKPDLIIVVPAEEKPRTQAALRRCWRPHGLLQGTVGSSWPVWPCSLPPIRVKVSLVSPVTRLSEISHFPEIPASQCIHATSCQLFLSNHCAVASVAKSIACTLLGLLISEPTFASQASPPGFAPSLTDLGLWDSTRMGRNWFAINWSIH